jgi:hypothetical protein
MIAGMNLFSHAKLGGKGKICQLKAILRILQSYRRAFFSKFLQNVHTWLVVIAVVQNLNNFHVW